jgi:hypothetical protein
MDAQALFGAATLTVSRQLTQPGQFAAAESVAVIGPKGKLDAVRVVGPARGETQLEIAVSDAVHLGVDPPVAVSGSLRDSTGGVISTSPRRILHGGDSAMATSSTFAVEWVRERQRCTACSFGPVTGMRPSCIWMRTKPVLLASRQVIRPGSSHGEVQPRESVRSSLSATWSGSPAKAVAFRPTRSSLRARGIALGR